MKIQFISKLFQKVNYNEELNRTNPDFVVYAPIGAKKGFDTGNEHFLVFKGKNGNLMCVWTQSTAEGANNQRIVFSRFNNEEEKWLKPKTIAGPIPLDTGNLASWGFPMVSNSGRIYVIYNKHIGKFDTFFHTTGLMYGIYSDDGESWSNPAQINMPRSIYDNPDTTFPSNWIVWQKPTRISEGKYFVGFTRWVSKAIRNESSDRSWISKESVVEFMRFENIDENPEINEIEIIYFAKNKNAIRIGYKNDEKVSVIQEPSVVKLPNGDLFCVMRTTLGSPYYIISKDEGKSWSDPNLLLYNDSGKRLLHPLSPCPIFQYDSNKYFILFHNHDGNYKNYTPFDTMKHRRPIYISTGIYKENSNQPIWFSQPKFLFDHTGIGLGPSKRQDLAMYSSYTYYNGNHILWYPDRKYFLLGKVLDDFLD